jgi:hypothetical protein
MSIQFKTLTFYNRPKEQLQERLRLKKFAISLSATIGALGSPLGPRLKRDLATDLYSSSTPIAIKTSPIAVSVSDDFKKATTSLQEVTEA